ncbi:MAG: hypothetical protein Kapaf2KO_10220 [Candidatus Kapaibacteriales bacterium]
MVAVAAALYLGVDSYAQGCITNGADGRITNLSGGTITFTDDGGYITNAAPIANITNDGTIAFNADNHVLDGANPLGNDFANTIPGTVTFNSANAQNVIADTYYYNLTMDDAGNKTIGDVFVSGTYDVTGNTGTRTYTPSTTFTYNGESGGIGNQNIVDDDYANLVLDNDATKAVLTGETVDVAGTTVLTNDNGATTIAGTFNAGGSFTQTAGGGDVLVDAGTLNLNDAANQSSFAGDVTLDNAGELDIAAAGGATFDGTLTVTDGNFNVSGGTGEITGTLALGNSADADVTVAASQTLDIQGTLTNARAERDNMNFDVASTVSYTGTNNPQNVISSSSANPYGNLVLSGGNKANDGNATEGNVNVAGDFSLAGGNFTVDADQSNDATDARSLVMLDNTNSLTYAADGEEVIGGVRWVAGAGGFATGTDYTLNNADAKFSFPAATAGTPAATNYLELRSYPGELPRQHDNTIDIDRLYQLWYDYNSWSDISLQLSWLDADEAGITTPAGDIHSTVRFWESDGSAAPNLEKISTGAPNAYTRVDGDASNYSYVEQKGIDPANTASPFTETVDGIVEGRFGHTNDFVMRSGPTTFYTVNHGRWSNPITWDEGVQPSSNDSVVVLHTVHAGYERATDNFTGDENTPENLARGITIDGNSGTGGASLMFGFGDPTLNGGAAVNWGLTGTEATLTVLELTAPNAVSAPGAPVLVGNDNDTASSTLYNGGLFVFTGTPLNISGCLNLNNGEFQNAGTYSAGN